VCTVRSLERVVATLYRQTVLFPRKDHGLIRHGLLTRRKSASSTRLVVGVARDIAAQCMCLDWGPDGVAGFQISLKEHVTLIHGTAMTAKHLAGTTSVWYHDRKDL
jgi:hypothetical protein